MAEDPDSGHGQPGIGVDARGMPVIDPTENVISLVKAGEVTGEKLRAGDQRYLDAQLAAMATLQTFAREADSRLQTFAREAESKLQTALREAETRRIDQLADTRQVFQNTIRDMLAESVRTTSTLVGSQLVAIQSTFDARVTKLEAAQLTQAGRSSVADPATEGALRSIAGTVASLSSRQDEALSRFSIALTELRSVESRTGGQTMGQRDSNARMLAVIMAIAAVVSPILTTIIAIMVMKGH